jgi:hypothetical protein
MEGGDSLRWSAFKISKKADKTNSWGFEDKICLDSNFNISVIMFEKLEKKIVIGIEQIQWRIYCKIGLLETIDW